MQRGLRQLALWVTGSRRAENYIPTPQLNFASMNTYKEKLTSWLCLLDDRFAEELDESEQSAVPVQQSTLDVGKAARSSKLWFLLRQSLSKFQRAQDLISRLLRKVRVLDTSSGACLTESSRCALGWKAKL